MTTIPRPYKRVLPPAIPGAEKWHLNDELLRIEQNSFSISEAITSMATDIDNFIAGSGFAPINSPVFTGDPTGPTPAAGDNDTSLATTAFVQTELADYALTTDLSLYAPLASPALTGTPTAPTAAANTNTTQIATTAYVQTELVDYAPLASPALTGVPTAPTAAADTNTTQIATTEYVQTEIADFIAGTGFAPINNPTFTGDPKAPTPAADDNDTSIATTAYVQTELADYLTTATAASTYLTQANAATTYAPIAAMPVGSVLPYTGAAAPSLWLLCYGQAISRTTYAALFAITSTTYGAGDGSTTFNLPDLRGRVVAGQDDMGGVSADRLTGASGGVDGDTLGATGGLETHTLTIAQMPSHNHGGTTSTSTDGAHTHTGSTNTDGAHQHTVNAEISSGTMNNNYPQGGADSNGTLTLTSSGAHSHAFTTDSGGSHNHSLTISSQGGGGAHNNVQPTIILNYIIYAGV